MTYDYDVIVVGCGVFGLSTILELAKKGYKILAIDAHQVPSPWSAGNDLNKIIRVEYSDKLNASLAIEALRLWESSLLYKEHFIKSGRLTLSPSNSQSARSIYEKKSFETLKALGLEQEVIKLTTPDDVSETISEFKDNNLPPQFESSYNSDCGTGLSDKALVAVYQAAVDLGVKFVFGSDGNAKNIRSHEVKVQSGEVYTADKVVVTAGASVVLLMPLDSQIRPWAAFVTHIKLTDAEYAKYKNMPIFFSAEYGYFFPPDSHTHKIKISLTTCDAFALGENHFHESEDLMKVPRYKTQFEKDTIPSNHIEDIKTLLNLVVPELANHKPIDSKTCWMADSYDSNFLIDKCPYYENVYVASGDSGHGFKFLPNIGKYIVKKLEGSLEPELDEAWRWKLNPDFAAKPSTRRPRPHLNLEDINFYEE